MSSLTDRIREVVGVTGSGDAGGASGAGDPKRPQGDSTAEPSGLAVKLGGEWRGGCLVVERRAEPSARHGRETVAEVAGCLQRASEEALLFAAGAPARPPFVFVDLETTGLCGGAGTHAFLVGCGWFDDHAFVTRQFVMARYADERTMLQAVAQDLGRAGAIVSFNGKSFDAPVLETRYLFHRLEWVGAGLPHLDVLHPARQFWKPGTDGWSLASLERHLIGHRRVGDVPGFEIPARYFQFVRTGDSGPLAAVLEHNRADLLSLAALTARLLDLVYSGPQAARHTREALALGRVYARAGLHSRAREAFLRAVALCAAPQGAFDATRIANLRALALAWRRERCYAESARCWQQLVETRGCPAHIAREATEALAIHHEHRVRDLRAARVFALRSLEAAEQGTPTAWTEGVRHRLARIERRIERMTGPLVTGRPPFPSLPLLPSCAAPRSAHRTSS